MNAAVKPESAEAVVFGKSDERELRDRMKKELPTDTFKAQTWRVIWFLPLQTIIWGGLAAILMAGLPWYANLGLGLLVGHTIGCQALLAHEVLHGALGMSRRWQNFFGWLGFGPLLVPPGFRHMVQLSVPDLFVQLSRPAGVVGASQAPQAVQRRQS